MKCFVALGGNFTNTFAAMRRAIALLYLEKKITKLTTSRVYSTTPVAAPKHRFFLNAVCCFNCEMGVEELWQRIREIESTIGKVPKPKEASRLIDLDLLFFGEVILHSKELTLPHPLWHRRLFVLKPLMDLSYQNFPASCNLKDAYETFSNSNQEEVKPFTGLDPFKEILS